MIIYLIKEAELQGLDIKKIKGQKQLWFYLRFIGEESNINLNASDHPEFGEYKWMTPEELVNQCIPFKNQNL